MDHCKALEFPKKPYSLITYLYHHIINLIITTVPVYYGSKDQLRTIYQIFMDHQTELQWSTNWGFHDLLDVLTIQIVLVKQIDAAPRESNGLQNLHRGKEGLLLKQKRMLSVFQNKHQSK